MLICHIRNTYSMGKVQKVMFVLFPFGTVLSYGIAIVLTSHAGMVRQNCKWMHQKLRVHTNTSFAKIIVRSYPLVVGAMLEPYGVVSSKLDILVCDDMLQNAITMLLTS